MIGAPAQEADAAGPAHALLAQGLDLDAGARERLQDAPVGRHGERLAGALEHDLERLVARARRDIGLRAAKQLVMHRALRPMRRRLAHGPDEPGRPAHIDMAGGRPLLEQCRDVEPARDVAPVEMGREARAQLRRQLADEGGLVAAARAIMQREGGIVRRQMTAHRHQRRDPDPARDQDMALARFVERKIVDGRGGYEGVAGPQMIVHPGRAAAAVGLAQHRDDVTVGLGAIIEQRIGSRLAVAERDIDMRARRETRQRPAGRGHQRHRLDARRDRLDAGDLERERHGDLPAALRSGPMMHRITGATKGHFWRREARNPPCPGGLSRCAFPA